jgi:glycosyltransferase involved in cell wall biosynthesis
LFEVIVVDNASSDRTAEVAQSFSFVRVVKESQKGLLWARQRGYLEAKGDYLAYIDADSHIHQNWFAILVAELEKREDIVALSGPGRYYDMSAFQNFFIIISWWLTAPLSYRIVGYMIFGANFVAKREALSAIGGFDTNIKFYGEDTDIARRLSKVGPVVFKMNFYIMTSARRFNKGGVFKESFVYALNFIWPVIKGKPFTEKYEDIR